MLEKNTKSAQNFQNMTSYKLKTENRQFTIQWSLVKLGETGPNRRLVILAGKAPVCCAGGSGSIPSQTTTQGLKIIEKVLPLL